MRWNNESDSRGETNMANTLVTWMRKLLDLAARRSSKPFGVQLGHLRMHVLARFQRRCRLLTEQPPDNQENPPEELSGQSAAASVLAFVSSLWHRLRRKAYWRWPSLFEDPDLSCHLASWADRDPEENCRSTPTAGESIEVHALWVVEAYP